MGLRSSSLVARTGQLPFCRHGALSRVAGGFPLETRRDTAHRSRAAFVHHDVAGGTPAPAIRLRQRWVGVFAVVDSHWILDAAALLFMAKSHEGEGLGVASAVELDLRSRIGLLGGRGAW